MLGEGKRYNEGKVRYDLVPPYAQEQFAKVLTMGADKYGPHNWKSGMKWSNVIASLERHLEAVKRGEDIDKESGLLHTAHIMCNAAFLAEYYKIYPQGDDRNPNQYLKPRIAWDIDGLLFPFCSHYLNYFCLDTTPPTHWNDPRFRDEERWSKIENNKEFWLSAKPLIESKDLLYEPDAYVTARSIDSSVTRKWLDDNGFPCAKLVSVGRGKSKVDTLKELNIDIFVDDSYENYLDLNKNGIFTYLYTASHNLKYDVGHKRINHLNEILK